MMRDAVFLPLTLEAAGSCGSGLRTKAEAANRAAAECWTAMVGDCDTPSRRTLVLTLHDLSEATAGTVQYRRVAEAEALIDEAVREGDGEEFAEALVGYDLAVATVLSRLRSQSA
ncbi:sugar ABC transporter substrate-binding protein [Lentzea sp. JNUCC 0626]|uniref:sugar ABC transporter substrate-binding protein n=1 Tax=Lentzea sp. JNUCC 0626 TaxID=3367513 RepID=UPI003748E440